MAQIEKEILRIDLALIPSEPQFSAIIDASQAVTTRFHNMNIIDAHRFPPHCSMHIATVPVDSNWEQIFTNGTWNLKPELIPGKLVKGTRGYILLELEITQAIKNLHEKLINTTAKLPKNVVEENPAWLQNYSSEDQENYHQYGSIYVLDKFKPHYSIAQVDLSDQEEAFVIAQESLGANLDSVIPSSFQVCDIGIRSEKWEVLFSH